MLFTIITVTLNSEKTIQKTINSINKQTFKNFEYIIIDGGSSDETIKVIKKIIRKKYKLISEKDSGIYNAMNKGIKMSKGKYVAFLNSDDWFNNNTLLDMSIFIKHKKPEIIYGDAVFFKDKKKSFYAKAKLQNLENTMSLLHSSFYIKSKIIKKYLFDENLQISSDYKQMIELKKKYKFNYYSKSLSNVAMGGKSSNLLLSSSEFFLIQKKNFGVNKAILNYSIKYHYHTIKILYLFIKNFF
tara:strand:+ start:1782 stop:2510 length:729 start_codon:yes stop_codon:yes gene_type:complete